MPMNNKFILILLVVTCFNSLSIKAQHTDLVDSSQTQVLADTSNKYFLPDLKRKQNSWSEFRTKAFTAQLGFAPIIDYNVFVQDNDSKTQVGKQQNQFDLRSGRFSIRGKLLFKNPWSYFISLEYKGMDRSPDEKPLGITDLKFVIPVSQKWNLTLGKIKETFVYEMVGDAANLPTQERILSPFFNSRNIGMTMGRTMVNDRMTFTTGWFNDWITSGQSFDKSANTYTSRITAVPIYENKGKRFVHIGLGYRYLEAENGVLRLKGRNESNVSSNYVDTKDFAGSHLQNFSFEQLWSLENFSIMNEFVHSWAKTPTGTEQFDGYYVTGSYIFSGEQRPYDLKAGYTRRVKPDGKNGALELVFRVSKLDLTTKNIDGGMLTKFTWGLNWWASQYWKAGVSYGVSNLDKGGLIGVTNSMQFRIQWIY
jgi:phosphate-selective porin